MPATYTRVKGLATTECRDRLRHLAAVNNLPSRNEILNFLSPLSHHQWLLIHTCMHSARIWRFARAVRFLKIKRDAPSMRFG
jgi:hypothetical protein